MILALMLAVCVWCLILLADNSPVIVQMKDITFDIHVCPWRSAWRLHNGHVCASAVTVVWYCGRATLEYLL